MKDAIQQGVVAEIQPEVTTVGGKGTKTNGTGDLIMDIAHEVENLSKAKVHSEATKLAENIEINYLRLGGILKLIRDNSWFEGFASFEQFVHEQFGYTSRKANYLIQIFDNLVTKQIPWDKVAHLGWTKLKLLASVLTPENVDEWAAKAEKLSRLELQSVLKAGTTGGVGSKAKTKSETTRLSFALKQDQFDIVMQALAKAKGELHTSYDSVALEHVMAGYVGGVTAAAGSWELDTVIKDAGFEPLLTRIAELFPEYDINVAPAALTS